ncbi:MAG: hypothetical protein SGPRY_002497 [Prymnesium sp.]
MPTAFCETVELQTDLYTSAAAKLQRAAGNHHFAVTTVAELKQLEASIKATLLKLDDEEKIYLGEAELTPFSDSMLDVMLSNARENSLKLAYLLAHRQLRVQDTSELSSLVESSCEDMVQELSIKELSSQLKPLKLVGPITHVICPLYVQSWKRMPQLFNMQASEKWPDLCCFCRKSHAGLDFSRFAVRMVPCPSYPMEGRCQVAGAEWPVQCSHCKKNHTGQPTSPPCIATEITFELPNPRCIDPVKNSYRQPIQVDYDTTLMKLEQEINTNLVPELRRSLKKHILRGGLVKNRVNKVKLQTLLHVGDYPLIHEIMYQLHMFQDVLIKEVLTRKMAKRVEMKMKEKALRKLGVHAKEQFDPDWEVVSLSEGVSSEQE